jgi:hypothetical protein
MMAELKRHNLAESTKINHKMAESANPENGFHWPLIGSQHLATSTTYNQEHVLSVKTHIGNCQKSQFLAAAAKLCRE